MLNLQLPTVERPFVQKLDCAGCSEKVTLDFDFTMAFQPVIDLERKEIFAQEALVRRLKSRIRRFDSFASHIAKPL